MASAFTIKDLSGATLFDVDDSGNVTMTGDISLVDLTLTGNAVVGNAATDTLAINADLTTGLKWDAGTYTYALDLSAMTTGQADVVIGDNLAEALVVRESSNAYLTIISTDSAEAVKIHKTIVSDALLTGAVTMADVTGGATDGAFSLQLKDLSNTNITSARRVMVLANATEAGPDSLSSTVTFATATTGSLVDSGNGWAVIDTDATGAFACTASNSADETIYFRIVPPRVSSSAGKYAAAVQAGATAVAWSA